MQVSLDLPDARSQISLAAYVGAIRAASQLALSLFGGAATEGS
jgi:hypothetical protein